MKDMEASVVHGYVSSEEIVEWTNVSIMLVVMGGLGLALSWSRRLMGVFVSEGAIMGEHLNEAFTCPINPSSTTNHVPSCVICPYLSTQAPFNLQVS